MIGNVNQANFSVLIYIFLKIIRVLLSSNLIATKYLFYDFDISIIEKAAITIPESL